MALDSFSQFLYLNPVNDTNFYLPFDEGSGEVTGEVAIGEYTVTTMAQAIQDALNTFGANTYTVTYDRENRTYTIASSGTFSLLVSTGATIGQSVFSLIGFTGSDTPSAVSATSNNAVGIIYAPQFKLQDYVASSDFQQATSADVSETASGQVEVVSFGRTQFIELSIEFATDIEQPSIGPIRNNPNGVNDLRDFLLFGITKAPFEFLPDESDPNTFETVILDKTPNSSKGVGFKLRETYTSGLPGYFETGRLTLRVV